MEETKNIHSNWLVKPTGDPFADTGGLVIKFLTELHLKKQVSELNEKNILGLIEFAAKIYVNNWGGKLHSFFPNSKITNPSVSLARKASETIELYRKIIENKEDHIHGYCRISGRDTELFSAGTSLYILVGSGGLINFHHGFQEGILVSKEILIRLFFVPFGVEYLSDKVALVVSNSQRVNEYLIKNKVIEHLRKFGSGLSNGILKSDFYNPVNALFDYADKCIQDLKLLALDEDESSNNEKVSLNLFHFTNFIQGPDVEIYEFPATVFSFYAGCIKYFKKDWILFTTANYRKFENYDKAIYNETTETYSEKVTEYILIPKKAVEKLKQFPQLNFKLSIAGEQQSSESDKRGLQNNNTADCFVFNKTEFEYWKQSKSYKEWKEDNKDFVIENKTIKEATILTYKKEDYKKKWANLIYRKLLSERSIIRNILKWNKKHSFSFLITTEYQIKLRNMKKETLQKIKELSDFIVRDANTDVIKKSITKLNGIKSSWEIRQYLLKLIAENFKEGNKNALITLEEFVDYLFPEGTSWREIRDLLLIAIYQKLHENQISVDIDLSETEILETQNENEYE